MISGSAKIQVYNSSLPEVNIELPATLILKSLDESHNGKYEFALISSGGFESASIYVFIAGKYFLQ